MLQIKASVVAVVNGSRKAVVGSGTTSMSLSWISWNPRIEEPSKPMPSSSASASTALGGTEKCCQTPGKSVNRKSIIWTFSSLIVLRTSWAVAQLRAMSFLPRLKAVVLDDCCSADQTPPSSQVRTSRPRRRRQAGRFNGHAASDAPISKACRLWPRLSGFVRPAHQLEGRFDVPPSFGVFAFALLFQGTSLLRGLGNRLVAVCFQQLPRVVVDFAFLHSHGVMLLYLQRASPHQSRVRERWTLTPIKTCRRILARRGGKSPRMHWSSPCGANAPQGATSTLWDHGASVCPSERPGATRSRTSCLISLISGKRPRSLRDQMTSSSTRTSKTPPVLSGVSVTEPSSSANVVNSSCAIQPARRPQPHNRQ